MFHWDLPEHPAHRPLSVIKRLVHPTEFGEVRYTAIGWEGCRVSPGVRQSKSNTISLTAPEIEEEAFHISS